MPMSGTRIKDFQKKVLSYYRQQGRELPWRATTNPYHILLSEIMLQQTQVDRVISYYKKWIAQWNSIEALAKASRQDVLKQWLGLGYNNRAVNLHKTAQVIVSKYRGDVLAALEHYKELPGIGQYTASAVRIFSANEDVVTVDTNIRRILIHEFSLDEKISDKGLWSLAEKCLPKGKSREWHNALMDYGALHLTSRKTGIKPKTQQSKFEGSDRQLRAQILKHLLTDSSEKKYSILTLRQLTGKKVPETRLKKILKGMVRDELLACKESRYLLR